MLNVLTFPMRKCEDPSTAAIEHRAGGLCGGVRRYCRHVLPCSWRKCYVVAVLPGPRTKDQGMCEHVDVPPGGNLNLSLRLLVDAKILEPFLQPSNNNTFMFVCPRVKCSSKHVQPVPCTF